MANLKELKRKIGSVKNTQKTTKAMKLVSSAKLRRTEELAKRSRVYASKLTELLSEIAARLVHNSVQGLDSIYFIEPNEIKSIDIVFVTADKGLCGGFNAQTIKRVNKLIDQYKKDDIKVRLHAIGRKGIDYYKFNGIELADETIGLSSAPTYKEAAAFISGLVDRFEKGQSDKIIMIHNGYVNMISQEMREEQLLPIDPTSLELDMVALSDLEIEPEDDDTILAALVKRYLEYSTYYALIDSLAAEHAARMQAMDSATKNAKEMVKKLTVQYNKARQEAITTELIEIISGMEALK